MSQLQASCTLKGKTGPMTERGQQFLGFVNLLSEEPISSIAFSFEPDPTVTHAKDRH
jgi:hypothetical protein